MRSQSQMSNHFMDAISGEIKFDSDNTDMRALEETKVDRKNCTKAFFLLN